MLSLLQKSLPKSLSRTLSLSRCTDFSFPSHMFDQCSRPPGVLASRPALLTVLPDSTLSMDELLFRSAEYPAGWDNGQYPDDYKPLSAPLNPQFILDNMLWYRASFKMEDKYLPMSFGPIEVPLHGFTLAALEMRRDCCTARILMPLLFSARKLLQAKRMGHDHRMKIGTSSFGLVDNDELLNIIDANLQRIWRDHLHRNELALGVSIRVLVMLSAMIPLCE